MYCAMKSTEFFHSDIILCCNYPGLTVVLSIIKEETLLLLLKQRYTIQILHNCKNGRIIEMKVTVTVKVRLLQTDK